VHGKAARFIDESEGNATKGEMAAQLIEPVAGLSDFYMVESGWQEKPGCLCRWA
jgi:hypothetical protein